MFFTKTEADDTEEQVIKLPKGSKSATVKDGSKEKKSNKRQRKGGRRKDGVLYIGHLGNDFQEPELAKFLGQFGKVRALRLSRSKRTGNPKGYAFAQMESNEIAEIVADTLSGYILFGKRRLVCQIVPPEKVHDDLFFKFVFRPPEPAKQQRSISKIKGVTEKLLERERKKRKVLVDLGIDYDFPGVEAAMSKGERKGSKKARKVSNVDVADSAVATEENEEVATPKGKKSQKEKTSTPSTEPNKKNKKSKKKKSRKSI